MFIVFENNPQLYNLADGLKLFSDADQAARYALNRGLHSPYAPSIDALKAQVATPGKSLTGGQTGFSVTLLNADPVDGFPNAAPPAAEADALKIQVAKLTDDNKFLSENIDLKAKAIQELTDGRTEAVNAVTVELEKAEAKVAALEAELAEFKKAALAKAEEPVTEGTNNAALKAETTPTKTSSKKTTEKADAK